MPTMRLRLIDEPPDRTRQVFTNPSPEVAFVFAIGMGEVDLLCGSCDRLLARSLAAGQKRDLVFRCQGCGRCNEMPT